VCVSALDNNNKKSNIIYVTKKKTVLYNKLLAVAVAGARVLVSGGLGLGCGLVTAECLVPVQRQKAHHDGPAHPEQRCEYSGDHPRLTNPDGDEHQNGGDDVTDQEHHVIDEHGHGAVDGGAELVDAEQEDDEDDDGQDERGRDDEVVETVHAITAAVRPLVHADDAAHTDHGFEYPQNPDSGLDVIRVERQTGTLGRHFDLMSTL